MTTPTPIYLHDVVLSHDYPDRPRRGPEACYVQGVVVGTRVLDGCPRYVIRVTHMTYNGRGIENKPPYVYPPVNGSVRSLDGSLTNGVELVDGGDEQRGIDPNGGLTDDGPITAEEVVEADKSLKFYLRRLRQREARDAKTRDLLKRFVEEDLTPEDMVEDRGARRNVCVAVQEGSPCPFDVPATSPHVVEDPCADCCYAGIMEQCMECAIDPVDPSDS